MLGLLYTYFSEIRFDAIANARKQKNPNYPVRDDLDKKKPRNKLKKGEAKPLISNEEGEKIESESRGGPGLRVKILMTKEEAARLLSKCKDGGVLDFKDVAGELVQIPTSRVSIVSSGTRCDSVLGAIPEELY